MLELNSLLLFSENPDSLADFYKKVLQKDPEMEQGGYHGFLVGKFFMTIGLHDKVKGKNQNPERLLLNFDTEDVKGEFERIKALGAEVVQEPYQPDEAKDMWIATFADPDGNYFQLTTPWKGEM